MDYSPLPQYGSSDGSSSTGILSSDTENAPLLGSPSGSSDLDTRISSSSSDAFSCYSCLGTVARGTWKATLRYSGLATEVFILIFDVMLLYALENEEDELSATTYLLLGLIGILYTPYYVHEIVKRSRDMSLAWRVSETPITWTSAGRILDSTNNLALTLTGCAAAAANQLGHEDIMKKIFTYTIPYGEAALAVGLGVRILTLVIDWQTLKKLRQEYSADELQLVADTLIGRERPLLELNSGPNDARTAELKKLAARVRACMDKDTLDTFMRALRDAEHAPGTTHIVELMAQGKSNIKVQLRVTQGGYLAVTVIGYGLLAIEKAHPYTTTGAICNLLGLGVNVAWMALDKGREACNRRAINAIDSSRDEVVNDPLGVYPPLQRAPASDGSDH